MPPARSGSSRGRSVADVHKIRAKPTRAKRQYRVVGRVCVYFEAAVHASSKKAAIAEAERLHYEAEFEVEETSRALEIDTVEPLE